MPYTYKKTQVQEKSSPPYGYTPTEKEQFINFHSKLPPLFDEPTTLKNFTTRVNWPQSILLFSTPVLGIYLGLNTKLQNKTLYFSIIYYLISVFGITAGYHRYWAHNSFKATNITRIILAIAGSSAFEGSIYWWSRGHRAHHRWTDSDKDPYAVTRGLFFSHIGWMLINRPKDKLGYADTTDLKNDSLVQFQHKYYVPFAIFLSFIFPALVVGLGWKDWKGGFVFAGLCRLVCIHHATFCVNSLAHYLGETPYADNYSPKNSWITAIITNGEGYHNFHHEFPHDYRNAILWYQYDPTKWLIKFLSFIRQTYDLNTFSANEIEKGRIQMIEKKVNEIKSNLKFGTPLYELPEYTMEEFESMVKVKHKQWILLDGFDHPGGSKYVDAGIGKDMTKFFNGIIYNHSKAARNLLTSKRVGIIKDEVIFNYLYSETEK
ncbi:hypothetical protein BDF21DRAFT_437348 [Thamnidium elegans]|nr:hypothetical protein BDF21DRAFT_437348 [Thamnidium elegans]